MSSRIIIKFTPVINFLIKIIHIKTYWDNQTKTIRILNKRSPNGSYLIQRQVHEFKSSQRIYVSRLVLGYYSIENNVNWIITWISIGKSNNYQ